MDERLFKNKKVIDDRAISYPISFCNLSKKEQSVMLENKEYFDLANSISEYFSRGKYFVSDVDILSARELFGKYTEPMIAKNDERTEKIYPLPRYDVLALSAALFSLGYRKDEVRIGMIFYKAQKKLHLPEYYVKEHILSGFMKTKDGVWVQSEETGNEMLLIGGSAFFDYDECEKCVKAKNLELDMESGDI